MEKQVYMVSKGKMAVITYNKAEAVKLAKKEDAAVYQLPYGYYKDCHFSMDSPTFRTVGKRII